MISGMAQNNLQSIPVALVACREYGEQGSAQAAMAAGAVPARTTGAAPTHAVDAVPALAAQAAGAVPGRPAQSVLEQAVDTAFTLAGYAPGRGERVLVKPNLLRADPLTCTEPAVVRAACVWLLDRGVRVSVGDSPGFGTAPGVAAAIGLRTALTSLRDALGNSITLEVQGPGPSTVSHLPGLGPVRIGRLALEADSILSIPRLKAHTHMGITCAVKNLFGCVPGVHKALAHARHGDKGENGDDLARYIVALLDRLPPQAALVDAVLTMHQRGPSHGVPYPLGLIAASTSCVAVDTALYHLLGLVPEQLPLWRAVREAGLPGALREEILLRGAKEDSFPGQGFRLPSTRAPHSFNPGRLAVSALRRLWAAIRS